MVTVKLKRPIENPCGDRALMIVGIHHVKEEFLAHWFIRGMMEAGDIAVVETVPSVSKPNETQISKPQPIVNVMVKESGSYIKVGNERIKVEEIKPKAEIEDYKMKVGKVEVNYISKDEGTEERPLQYQEPEEKPLKKIENFKEIARVKRNKKSIER